MQSDIPTSTRNENKNMTTLHLRKSVGRSPLRRGLSLIPFSLASALAVSALIIFAPINTRADTCTPPPPDMVNWWPGDGIAIDIQGSNDATPVNGATFAPGKVGQAFSFDGVNDVVSVPDNPSLTLGAGPFSIDLWVKFNLLAGREPFIAHDEGGGNTNKWIFWYDAVGEQLPGPALRFAINGPGIGPVDTIFAPWNPNTGQWYHVGVTRNGSTYTLYIDGLAVTTATNTIAIPDPTVPLTIGKAEAYLLHGLIDEVEIFHRTLSDSEIQAIYNAGSAGKCKPPCIPPPPDMISWWPGDGNANDIIGSTNGTLQNGATFAPGYGWAGVQF